MNINESNREKYCMRCRSTCAALALRLAIQWAGMRSDQKDCILDLCSLAKPWTVPINDESVFMNSIPNPSQAIDDQSSASQGQALPREAGMRVAEPTQMPRSRLRDEIWCHIAEPTDQAFLRSFCHSIEFHAFSLRNGSGDFQELSVA
jgi:hypothetical protein